MSRWSERGAALVLAIIAIVLMSALSASLVVLSNTELKIAANYADAAELRYVAEAALEIALQELASIPDWSVLPGGPAASALTDGAPGGRRTLSDGTSVDLDELHAQAVADDSTARLFSFAPAERLQPGASLAVNAYIVVWIGDDLAAEPEILTVRAEAFGASRTRRMLAARVQRTDTGVRIVSWHELR